MAKPQPTRSQQLVKDNVQEPRKQIPMMVFREVLAELPPEYRLYLTEMMGCFIFIDFCKLNITKVNEQLKEITDFQLSQDMRLLWRFWTDLLRLAEEYKEINRANNEG